MSVAGLVEHFSALEDPRCAGNVEHQALLAGPGADPMQRPLRPAAIEGAAQGLAVDRHDPLPLVSQTFVFETFRFFP
jgi:hypothetical protein